MNNAPIQLSAKVLQMEPSELNTSCSLDRAQPRDSLAANEEAFKARLPTQEIIKVPIIGFAQKMRQGKNVAV